MDTNTTKPLIGMLRQFEKPNTMAKAAALSAAMLDCDFFFFNPDDVDMHNEKINGLFLKSGEWTKSITRFPDVIDNSPPRRASREVYKELEKTIPFTMHRIGNKDFVSKRLMRDKKYDGFVIPYKELRSVNDVFEMLQSNTSLIIKPAGGNRGQGIIYIEKKDSNFIVKTLDNITNYNAEEFGKYIEEMAERKYIVQSYISSVTKSNLPFDIRIHVRRGDDGKWKNVKIYPRIGSGKSVESNLSQGGSLAQIGPFLKYNFAENWKEILSELRKLGREFPVYFQEGYDNQLDALGLDIGIDEKGKLWLFEVNSFPGSTMFELEAQEVAMKYAKYLALEQKNQTSAIQIINNKKPVIAMLSPAKGISKLKSACVAAASMYDCEFFYFTPDDIDYEEKTIHGKTYIDYKWETKEYSYTEGIDVIYDRIRLVGRNKYKKVYDTLNHIPLTHHSFGGTLNKIEVYDKFKSEGTLADHIVPYTHYKDVDSTVNFIEEHKKIIIKPQIGLMGNGLYYIEKNESSYEVINKNAELKFNEEEFKLWLAQTVNAEPYVVQKYIHTRTKDDAPFDVRVHMMRNDKNKWDFIVILPRVGIGYEKITAMSEGGYISQWAGFIKRNYGEEMYPAINKQMRYVSKKFTKKFEEIYNTEISEIGIDFAIDESGHVFMLELNLRRPGFLYYEFDVAKRAIGYARYLYENKNH